MKSFNQYINDINSTIDAHIHLFDHNGFINPQIIRDQKCICFADIVFSHLDKYQNGKTIKMYDDFIKNYFDPSKHILLATADNADDIISIYKKYPQYIKGFGELKCYDSYKGMSLSYGNLKWIKPILEFNKDLKLPTYIHFELDNIDHRRQFENILFEYDFPIVLCHCGFTKDRSLDNDIYLFVKKLMYKYRNLYIDLSECKTREFFIENKDKLISLDPYRVLVGSDINPEAAHVVDDIHQFTNKCYNQCRQLNELINNSRNVKLLFKI